MPNNGFNPWWYYEMGRQSTESSNRPRQKSAPTRKAGLYIGLVIFWIFLTAILAIVTYIIATVFGGIDFWLCLVIGGFISFWLCSLIAG